MNADGALVLMLDLSLANGTATGPVTVNLPVGAQYNGLTATIYHCPTPGSATLERVTCTVANGMATGVFSSLSPFGVSVTVPQPLPKAGDTFPLWGMVALIAVMIAAAGWIGVARRKRFN